MPRAFCSASARRFREQGIRRDASRQVLNDGVVPRTSDVRILTTSAGNAAEIQRHLESGEHILKASSTLLRQWLTTVGCITTRLSTVSLSWFRRAFARSRHARGRSAVWFRAPSARCREGVVPAAILDKPEALTDEEMSVIRKHPRLA